MMAGRFNERRKSAQSCPVSGGGRAASRTMVPPILLSQNRHPHRRWRGRFAVLDPTRPLPGAASCLSGSGGKDDASAAYRRTAGRTRMERRSGRNPADQGRTGGRPGRPGSTRWLRATREGCPAIPLRLFHDRGQGVWSECGLRKSRKGRRQDKRNGAMSSGHRAITLCLHIIFLGFCYGATFGLRAPWLPQQAELTRYFMAPWLFLHALPRRSRRHG